MTVPSAWVLLPPEQVPERWRHRSVPVMMVSLVGEETDALLGDQPAAPITDPREIRLLRLVARAEPIRTIARELGIGERATQKRLAALRERFDVGSTAELSALLAAGGLRGVTEAGEVDGDEAGLDP